MGRKSVRDLELTRFRGHIFNVEIEGDSRCPVVEQHTRRSSGRKWSSWFTPAASVRCFTTDFPTARQRGSARRIFIIFYFEICFTALLVGNGLIFLLRFRPLSPGTLLAAPGVTVAVVSSALVTGRVLGIPLSVLIDWVVIVSIVLAGVGTYALWQLRPRLMEVAALVMALVCPIILVWPFFRWGLSQYPGSWYWDGWNYILHAQFLLDQPLGNSLAQSPLYLQWMASGMDATRFAAASIIGLLSSLVGGPDAYAGFGPLITLVVFVFASSCGFAAVTLWGSSDPRVALTTLVAGTGGWILGAVQVNNLDSLLLVSFLPVVYGTALVARSDRWGGAILFGFGLGSLLCVQSELLPLACVAPGLGLLQRMMSNKDVTSWLRWALIAIAGFLTAAAAWLPEALHQFAHLVQFLDTTIGPLPGQGYFQSLMNGAIRWPALWGLYAPWDGEAPVLPTLGGAIAGILSVSLLIGFHHAIKGGKWAASVSLVILLCGAAYMLVYKGYTYGAYKFLLVGWFVAALLVVDGAFQTVMALTSRRSIIAALSTGLVLLAPVSLGLAFRARQWDGMIPVKDMSYYRQVQSISKILGKERVVFAVSDTSSNTQPYLWGLFFLRDVALDPSIFNDSLLAAAARRQGVAAGSLDQRSPYVLTDATVDLACPGSPHQVIWQGGAYRMWHVGEDGWAIVKSAENPNGVEKFEGVPSMWLGGSPAYIEVKSTEGGWGSFIADFSPGPSLPESPLRTIEITVLGEYRARLGFSSPGRYTILLPLVAGNNRIEIRVLENPTVPVQPNGDPRPLLVMMQNYQVCLKGK